MRGIVKVFVVWTLGFVMLFGSTGVSLALPKIQGGHSYCQCSCRNATGFADLTWEKVASCGLNGRACSFNNSNAGGQLQSGKLDSCMNCTGDANGGLDCTAAMTLQPGQLAPPQGGTMLPPNSPPPLPPTRPGTVAPGMRAPIMPRGIEGEPATSAPTEQEEKATAPK